MAISIHPAAHIGYVKLKVSNMERSLLFYKAVVGFKELSRSGNEVQLTADGKRPLLILQEQQGAVVLPERAAAGLYHFAILLPSREALGLALRNLANHNVPVGQGDHLVSEALYFNDPDNNGIEIYRDRPREQWEKLEGGGYKMATDPVDIQGLLDVSEGKVWNGLPEGTVIGHVHLHVSHLPQAQQFYCDTLGFDIIFNMGGSALFISAGGYHHHLGLNTWAGVGVPAAPANAAGLAYYTIVLPDRAAMDEVLARLGQKQIQFREQAEGWMVTDPSGISSLLTIGG
ncbi:catechol 2,3-dioxygenase [Paenibacillus algorifonticola]|uniref:Catechol 2,3-dioxygenase n=1 Tax=Paenibacillus algorifonticola TaxID=684063 RepID=A0A1I2J1Y1_9BACL|nr:VOC family protein [Paenibacillus algorifonticola]SFF48018.1 catechol 2,3-dioxygenase [Paenibacillus algorifonticola]